MKISVNAVKGSGGVGLLINTNMFGNYNIKIIDKAVDGILAISFQNKHNDSSFIIISVYLPPEGSPYADTEIFFSHLISLIYIHGYVDSIFICGDVNARLGTEQDYIPNIDNLIERRAIDDIKNSYGDCLIEFLKITKMCILNGRFIEEYDNFTCINTKGKSVVDYCITHHLNLNKCTNFKVLTISDMLEKYNLVNYQTVKCKVPDHSLLYFEFMPRYIETNKQPQGISYSKTGHAKQQNNPTKKYKFNHCPSLFLNNEIFRQSMVEIINQLEVYQQTQDTMDNLYDNMCKTILNDMDVYLDFSNVSMKTKKLYKNNKPYWDEELTSTWKNMSMAEKVFLKCKGHRNVKSNLRKDFLEKKTHF